MMNLICKSMVLFFLTYAGASYATIQPCPDCPEIPAPVITYNNIVDAYNEYGLDYAWEVTQEFAIQELINTLNNDPEKVYNTLDRGKEFLKKILEDPTLTDEDKGKNILAEIEKSMSESQSEASGVLNLTLAHSVNFGVTRLSWDKKIEVDKCEGQLAGFICPVYDGAECAAEWEWRVVTWIDYVKKVPDYHIYRIVNGNEKLVTTLKGNQEINREEVSLSDDVFKSIKSIFEADFDFDFDISDEQAFYHDYRSELREIGSTLEYKVVSDNSSYQFGDCGSSEKYTSTVSMDSNGDLMADFIPQEEYRSNNIAWFIPIMTLLLN